MSERRILQVEDLAIDYIVLGGPIKAVRGVSFNINEGEVACLVGESGSGKSTVGLAVAGALPENAIIRKGEILFEGRNLVSGKHKNMRTHSIMIVFQDPAASLNPLFTVGEVISDVVRSRLKVRDRSKIREKALEMFRIVELPDPERIFNSYPHELSGGMLQRVVIAISLSANPKLLIADEPTTMLDVTLQAQIIELLSNLKKKLGLSMLFITHNLGVAREIGDKIIVMYGGEIIEEAGSIELISNPLHPYTKGLLECIPRTHIKHSRLKHIPGAVPDLRSPTMGCIFSERCTWVMSECRIAKPLLKEYGGGHKVACHLYVEENR